MQELRGDSKGVSRNAPISLAASRPIPGFGRICFCRVPGLLVIDQDADKGGVKREGEGMRWFDMKGADFPPFQRWVEEACYDFFSWCFTG